MFIRSDRNWELLQIRVFEMQKFVFVFILWVVAVAKRASIQEWVVVRVTEETTVVKGRRGHIDSLYCSESFYRLDSFCRFVSCLSFSESPKDHENELWNERLSSENSNSKTGESESYTKRWQSVQNTYYMNMTSFALKMVWCMFMFLEALLWIGSLFAIYIYMVPPQRPTFLPFLLLFTLFLSLFARRSEQSFFGR